MRNFGRANGGGRRASLREHAPILVVYFTMSRSDTADLVNISATGARLRGDMLPDKGEELVMTMEGVRTYGSVVWSDDDECGVAFDRPLVPGSLQKLRHSVLLAGGLTPDQKQAFDMWTMGAAR